MKQIYLSLGFVLSAFLPLLAQNREVIDLRHNKNYGVNCDQFANSPGCKSYNELVESNDEDILRSLKQGSALVCFRETEDVFILIWFDQPDDIIYRKSSKGPFVTAFGVVYYSRFSKGLSEEFKFIPGSWTKYSNEDTSPTFTQNQGARVQATIDNSEESVGFSFTNLAKATTNYSIQVRRSTLRFTEDYLFPSDDKQRTETRFSLTGHCTDFR